MTYDPTVPDLPNEVTVDIPKMNTNASQLDIYMDKDHYKWSTSSTANRARHRQITFPNALSVIPNLLSYQGIVFPFADQNDVNTRTQIYYKNTTETQQITSRFHEVHYAQPAPLTSSYGYWMLPGGTAGTPPLILAWAFQAIDTDPNGNSPWSQTHIVHFNPIEDYAYSGGQTYGFPNNLLAITCNVCNQDASPTAKTCSVDAFNVLTNKQQFRIKLSDLTISGIYYIALGN